MRRLQTLGVFEELTRAQIGRQYATNVFLVFEVTRAGIEIPAPGTSSPIASVASITGGAGSTIYDATKFVVTC